MKIYYTTDGTIDDNLQQVCPFGELHHFTRADGSEYTMIKYVGCGGCVDCKYCYGKGFTGYYGNKSEWMMIPKKIIPDYEWNYDESEKKKIELGSKQFSVITENDYICCAKCYNDEFREKNKKLKFKIWWWHHVGIKIDHLHYNVDKFYCDKRYKIERFFRKIFKRN